jgi:hypothetical protein
MQIASTCITARLQARVVPDAIWPGMFRILTQGLLSDLTNLSRAKDARLYRARKAYPSLPILALRSLRNLLLILVNELADCLPVEGLPVQPRA